MLGRIAMFFFVAYVVLLIAAVSDCLGGEQRPQRLPRSLWVLLIVVVPFAGAVLWFTHGRPKKTAAAHRAPFRRHMPEPVAPDDDPQFLADLQRRLREDNDDR